MKQRAIYCERWQQMVIDLRCVPFPLEQELQNHSVILPRKGVLELVRLLETNDEPARLQIGTNNLRVHLKNTVFTSKLIDGRFPDYRRVLPRNATKLSKAIGKY